MKHTPGKLTAEPMPDGNEGLWKVVSHEGGSRVCPFHVACFLTEANAKYIALSWNTQPDLLEALEGFINLYGFEDSAGIEGSSQVFALGRAAIAKARPE